MLVSQVIHVICNNLAILVTKIRLFFDMSKKIGIEMEKLPFFLSLFLLFRILLLFLQCIPLAIWETIYPSM